MSEDIMHRPQDGEDRNLDVSLRPGQFADFTGQDKIKERLLVSVQAAKQRGQALDHILLNGPPGLGKTTLAHILAAAMGVNITVTSGPVIEKAGDLAGLLTKMGEKDILFIDEIHRLQKTIEEYLYPAMEDFKLDIVIDQGANARSVNLPLPRFTLIGATTRSGLISAPLRSRFGLSCRLDYYEQKELTLIIKRAARLLNVEIDDLGAVEIALRSRGTPRVANNLLRWTRDYALVKADGSITSPVAIQALAMLEIDEDGLDEMDKRILESIIFKFSGGPVGLSSLAVSVSEDPGTIEDVYEPYLIMKGFIKRTPTGRMANPKAFQKLGVAPPKSNGQLF